MPLCASSFVLVNMKVYPFPLFVLRNLRMTLLFEDYSLEVFLPASFDATAAQVATTSGRFDPEIFLGLETGKSGTSAKVMRPLPVTCDADGVRFRSCSTGGKHASSSWLAEAG